MASQVCAEDFYISIPEIIEVLDGAKPVDLAGLRGLRRPH